MRWVLFLSRVAFICNVFSLLTILLLWKNFIGDQVIVSTIAIMGYFLAIIFNPLVNIIYGILLLSKQPLFMIVPKWLVITNFVFLLLQLQYIFFLNDTLHH
jgi:hypothetical protein